MTTPGADKTRPVGRRTIRTPLRVVAALVGIAVAAVWWLDFRPSGPDVPALRMVSALNSDPRAADLLLKSCPDGALLLSYATRREASSGQFELTDEDDEGCRVGRISYRYDPGTESLEPISEDVWSSRPGTYCLGGYQLHGPDVLAIDQRFRLTLNSTPIHTAGKNALKIQYAPHSNRVAVLSADGFRQPTGTLSGAIATGQHYHQVFSVPEGKPIGEPVRLPLKSKDVSLNVCWSEDERFVVYYGVSIVDLCVVQIEPPGGNMAAMGSRITSRPVSASGRPATSRRERSFPRGQAQPPPFCVPPAPVMLPENLHLDLGQGCNMDLVLIPAGEFEMGSSTCENTERFEDLACPRHLVRICKPFYMGKYEVTQFQWKTVMGYDPSEFDGDNLPVESVSWEDCQQFCRMLSLMTGRSARLPSEAEWEYACRGGTTTNTYMAPVTVETANCNSAGSNVPRERTITVGSYPPNPFGLYDVYGNVGEWCQDVFYDQYFGAPSDGSARAKEREGAPREYVSRGGSWKEWCLICGSVDRGYAADADHRRNYIGLRVVVDLDGGVIVDPSQ